MEKFRTRDTKHLSTDADSITDTKKILIEKPNLLKKNLFEEMFSNLRPLLSKTFPQEFLNFFKVWTLDFGKGGEKMFKWS